VLVILVLAGLAILGGVVFAALGRAGEMATFPADHAPLDTGSLSAGDVSLLRPPMALWGYQVQATEEALQVIARSVTARDATIAALRRQLDELRGERAQRVTDGVAGEHGWPPADAGDAGQAWPLEDAEGSAQGWPAGDTGDSGQAWPLEDAEGSAQGWPTEDARDSGHAWPLEDAEVDGAPAWSAAEPPGHEHSWPVPGEPPAGDQPWPVPEAPTDVAAWPDAGAAEDGQIWPLSSSEADADVWPAAGQARDLPAPPAPPGADG
jgi:hypothetical protein